MTIFAIKESKSHLRKHIKKSLKLISQESLIQQSHDIHKLILDHPQFKQATKIALYMNMPDSEVKTLDIIKSCFEMGKSVYLPKCNYHKTLIRKHNHLTMLKLSSFEDVLELKPHGKYKLLEPTEGDDVFHDSAGLDMIIVPAVAFTTLKQRMGHGAGYYDEYISSHVKHFGKKPYLLGIGLQEQLVDHLHTEEHDWSLDSIIIGGEDHRIIY
ncbi:5,10-methenyltetrahydrofolate synthetase [Scheffersomyces coipomensis]|uniref:5,10-methenyltetrahydrofolate synthetase n=1 Tax=Scheffersomyces coipomensis TaxID=1788519 RepID=UPI00315CB08B